MMPKKKAVSSAMVENISVLCYAISKKKAAIFKDVRTAVTIVTYVISVKCIY